MKGYKLKHAEKYVETKNKKYLLSVVALILTVCMLISVTYSWIDNISKISVVAQKPNGQTTLKIDSETNSVIDVTTDKEVIDIGSYFSNSGNMTLTACSGDGRDFYFKKSQSDSSTTSYRRGTANDVNVNYISCTFKVNSKNDSTVFWMNEVPKLMDGTTDLSAYLRCAITVDDETIILANNGNYNCIKNIAGETKTCTASKPSSYLWESSLESGKGSNDYLFFMEKGETKTVTVKMWLEDPTSTLSINTHNLTLSMSMLATLNRQTIYLNDHTFNASGRNLLSSLSTGEELGNIFYMCLADDVDTYWTFSYVDGTDATYMAEIPIIYRNKNVHIMRCSGSYGAGSTLLEGTLYYKNKWDAVLPETAEDATYSVLGEATNGAWVETVRVDCDDQYGFNPDTTKMTLGDLNVNMGRDMYYDDTVGCWVGYVLPTSDKIKFTADLATDIEWGYCSNTGNQTRPIEDDVTAYTYTIYDVDDGAWYTGATKYAETVSSYVIKGDFNNWKGTPMLYSDEANYLSYASMTLEPGTYDFKIYSNNSYKWYGNGASYKFGTSNNSAEQTFTLAEGGENSSIVVQSATKGNVLFVYNGNTHKLNIKFSPYQPVDNDASVYVAVKNDLEGGNWLSKINHWGESGKVATTVRTVSKVGSYNITNYPTSNCYTVTEGTWDSGGGTWSYVTAAHDKLLLKPNANWKSDEARFAAYFFGNGDKWVSMEDGGNGYYAVTIPTDVTYPSVIFCRMDPATTANNWDNRWNQTGNLSVPTKSSSASTTYDLYYVNLDKDATNMQWVEADGTTGRPNQSPGATTNGYYFNHNPLNGTMYYMTADNATFGCSKLTTNRQTPPTLKVNGSTNNVVTVNAGDVVTLSTTGTATSGTAYKSANSATYYVRKVMSDGTTSSDKVVNSSWTPNRPGTYKVRARFDDGYITSGVNNVITITVK